MSIEKELFEGQVSHTAIVDGSVAVAETAYVCVDGAFIYPITPSSAASEHFESLSAQRKLNAFGNVSSVRQLQSEAGAAGSVHGGLSVGAMTTTFTASQGLLLMIPPMYKIAGEFLPAVFHVSARAIAGQALSIFGDHSDVMSCRATGFAMLCSNSVQESADMALVAHIATLKASIPFMHFYDGFRTSHEIQKIQMFNTDFVKHLLPTDAIQKFRDGALNPTHPYLKGTSQGPEVYMQNVEMCNSHYDRVPDFVEETFAALHKYTGRSYSLFEYHGDPNAEMVVVCMGSGVSVIRETLAFEKFGANRGVICARLYRPWKVDKFLEFIPKTCKRIAVLDRTKESGSLAEPLFLDVVGSVINMDNCPRVIGGRFGLGSREFTPEMVHAVFLNLESSKPKHPFTVGINDDVTNLSLPYHMHNVNSVPAGTRQCLFWGMGSDGTVGANKNVIKIIGQNTDLKVQGYFAYSAYKAGGLTMSHLRFGPEEIKSSYQLRRADYVAAHRTQYVFDFNVAENLNDKGTFLLNTQWAVEDINRLLPAGVKRDIANRDARMFVIDANRVAVENGMGRRVNNILMTCFFKLSEVLPMEEAIALFKSAIQKTYGKKGQHVVDANNKAVDAALANLHQVHYDLDLWKNAKDSESDTGSTGTGDVEQNPTEKFVTDILLKVQKREADLPISAFKEYEGGKLPMGTANYEKRGIALNVPIVNMDKCTQCNYCSFVCPHAAIRPFLLDDDEAERAPESFNTKKSRGVPEFAGMQYRIQVAPLDCTGCQLCAIACPDEALTMTPLAEVSDREAENWAYARALPNRAEILPAQTRSTLKGSQFYQPLLEFSGACEGCGETPYVKLLTQLYGERMVIANATGCSSIWGGSFPSVPYTTNNKGLGPAWGNSLFEDNAEYGYGMVMSIATRREYLKRLVDSVVSSQELVDLCDATVLAHLKDWQVGWTNDIVCQKVYDGLKDTIDAEASKHPTFDEIAKNKDMLPKICIWLIGGDGWAFDIGYGGLDHIMAQGVDVNVLVLDTEVYSNTGGQVSKATMAGAVHKFATGGRTRNKKDLGMLMMEYGDVYVASISSSANMAQTVRAIVEAERYNGSSLILAYSPCIEHQYIKPFSQQIEHTKLAVDSGYWPLYRFNPALADVGELPLQLDSKKLKADIKTMLNKENRFSILRRTKPEMADKCLEQLEKWAVERFQRLKFRSEYGDYGQLINSQGQDEDAVFILYGSETGNAEELAGRACRTLKNRGLTAKVKSFYEVGVEDVAAMRNVIIFCSTAGQGEFPGNTKDFWAALRQANPEEKPFENVNVATFGLGDSCYVFFNVAALNLHKRFLELGATEVMSVGMGDDCDDDKFETAFADWFPEYLLAVKAPEEQNVVETPDASVYQVVDRPAAEIKPCLHMGTRHIKLVENRRITPTDYDVEVRHLEFDLSGTDMKYALGDSLAIWPQNDPVEVDKFCMHYGYNPNRWVQIRPVGTESNAKYDVLFKNDITVRQLFVECLDFAGKPTRGFYDGLWKHCKDPNEKESARKLLTTDEGKCQVKGWLKSSLTFFDVMKIFPSIMPSLEEMIDLLPLIRCRYYSIASCQKFVGEDKLQLCVGIVDWMNPQGALRTGEATGTIRRFAQIGESLSHTVCGAIKATAFNLPPTDLHPIIVAGMGTGLAPFRAFIQHRVWLKRSGKPVGPMTVYFGCRYAAKDFLYGEEMNAYLEEGVLTELKCAFSRDTDKKHYIQHEIYNDPDTFFKRFITEEGYFYLCGSAKQVPIDIRRAVTTVLSMNGGLSFEEADERLTQLILQGRYNVEAW